MSTNSTKALFQVDNGDGWQTIAEADITNGIVQPPNAWTMVRAMRKQIVYVGYTPVKMLETPEKITLDHTEYYWLTDLLSSKITERMRLAESDPYHSQSDGTAYLEALLKKLIPYQIGNRQVELRLAGEEQ